MGLQNRRLDADSAFITVCMVFCTSYTTDAAFLAVVLALVDVIQKNARRAPIGAQRYATGSAGLRRVLYRLAERALDRGDGVTVHCMGLFPIDRVLTLHLVVAKATAEPLAAAGREESRFPFIMGAAFVCDSSRGCVDGFRHGTFCTLSEV